MHDERDRLENDLTAYYRALDEHVAARVGDPARAAVSAAAPRWRSGRVTRLGGALAGVVAVLLVAAVALATHLGVPATSTARPAAPVRSAPASASAVPATVSPSPSATAAPGPANRVVWAVDTGPGMVVRTGAPGDAFRTVATVPHDTTPVALGAGGNRLLFTEVATGHLYDMDLATGVSSDHGGAAGTHFYGGAFAPDGERVEYVRQSASGATLERLDLTTGVVTVVRQFTSTLLDVPRTWSIAGVAALQEYHPNVDAPSPGVVLLDPGSGAVLARTPAQIIGAAFSGDGRNAAATTASRLGESYRMGAGNPNTLDGVTIGAAAPVMLRQEKNHLLGVQAVSPDGSAVVVSDDPGLGNYAGITQSPDFGLFVLRDGVRTQVARYDLSSYSGGAFVGASDFVVINVNGGGVTLLVSHGGAATPVDSVAGGRPGAVWAITGA